MHLTDRIGRRMKLQDLHVLLTVAQAGSMGKAARYLNTSQPAISRSIADLEHAFGVRLFDRHQQGIEPTDYGHALLDCGLAVFDDLRQGVKNIQLLADPTAGEIRIGSIAPLAASFVSAIIDRLSRRHPHIVFHLVTAQTEVLHRELNERSVDLVIARRFGLFADKQFKFESLYNDMNVVVAGVRNPLVRRRKIELAELMNESWTLPPPKSVFGSTIVEAFHAAGLDYPRATVFTLPPEVRMNLLATGRFLTIFPTSLLKFSAMGPALKVLPVKLSMARVPIGIVTLKTRTISPVVQHFIDSAREVARPLTK